MNRWPSWLLLWSGLVLATCCKAQEFEVISGPIYGHYTDSTRQFWMALAPKDPLIPFADWLGSLNADVYRYFRQEHQLRVLDVQMSHLVLDQYLLVKGMVAPPATTSTNNDLAFLVGSCAFPYPFLFWKEKDRAIIFETMAAHQKDFMIWMGDNVYYLNGEWRRPERMHRKNLRMRNHSKLHAFLRSCPQYAIWDDHDYGPNNAHHNFRYKYQSLAVFQQYWSNPYAGLDTVPGIFCHFRQGDAEFFLLDGRFHSNDTSMLGQEQLNWLKQGLKRSTANFKFIVSGTQILPDNPLGEDWGDFGNERDELLQFLVQERISGVLFLSGDRHYGELLRLEQSEAYPLYEMTSSPLTSLVNPAYTKNNPLREAETLAVEANFGKIELLGSGPDRLCRLNLFDKSGQLLWQKDVYLVDLQF